MFKNERQLLDLGKSFTEELVPHLRGAERFDHVELLYVGWQRDERTVS